MNNDDWIYEHDEDKEFIIPTKYLIFDPKKRKICVNHYLTIDDLRVKTDTELDMKRKQLFNMGEYELEEGELFE
jgi:hypothetical protein